MDTKAELERLVGRRGLLKIKHQGEVPFTYLGVSPPDDFPAETTLEAFHDIVTRCEFRIRFDDGVLFEGSDTMDVSGFFISRLDIGG